MTQRSENECKPTLVNILSFEDKDKPDGNTYMAKFKLSIRYGKVIFDMVLWSGPDFNPDKIAISTDFKNIKGIDSSKRQSLFYEITIEERIKQRIS